MAATRSPASVQDSVVYQNFMTQALPFDRLRAGDIPNLAEANIQHLASLQTDGLFVVDTPAKVMGLFALFNRKVDEFENCLVEKCDMLPRYAKRIADALHDKTLDFCNDDDYPKGASGNVPGTQTSVVAHNFDQNKLSTVRLSTQGGVVPGLAAKVTTVESRVRKLLKQLGGSGAGTLSTLQLVGLYMLMGEQGFVTFLEGAISERNLDKVVAVLASKERNLCDKRTVRTSPVQPVPTPRNLDNPPVSSPSMPIGVMLAGLFFLLAAIYLKFLS